MLRVGAAAVLLAGAGFAVAFLCVLVVAQQDDAARADAIVVLGAAQYNGRPSPVLRARLDHAIGLFRRGLAGRILVTGGTAEGDRESEAAVARRYLVQQRIPDSAVVAQPVGRDTRRSMDAVADWAAARGLRRLLLVSDPFHMLRLRLEARRLGLEATTSPTDTSPISESPIVELQYLAAEALKVPVAWVGAMGRKGT
ncbi:MAG: YdcF family protein [Gemmatimonadales bacterium]|nr:YdcF family protein [Gemmatimonadales bacterium]